MLLRWWSLTVSLVDTLQHTTSYRKNLNNWTVCYVVGLSSLAVRPSNFLFLFCLGGGERGSVFAVFFAPFPEKGILNHIAHGPIIQVLNLRYSTPGLLASQFFRFGGWPAQGILSGYNTRFPRENVTNH